MSDTVDIKIDEFLPIVPEGETEEFQIEETKKSNLFKTSENVDLSFIEDEEDQVPTKEEEKPEEEKVEKPTDFNIEQPGEEKVEKPTSKMDSSEAINNLIEKGVLLPFEEGEIAPDDYEELIEANFSHRLEQKQEELKNEFFSALPEEMKYVADYIANGGQDLKSVFKALGDSVEVKEFDPGKNPASIVSTYLSATDFGTAEEIQEQIEEWSDLGVLQKKAKGFKPKLDKMNEKILENKVKEQELRAAEQREMAEKFTNNVFTELEKGEIGGIKLSNDEQNMLFKDITEPRHPSLSGGKTNLLGHLLEKYQFSEPNLGLVAEAVWLLKDPEGYKERIKSIGAEEETKKTVRTLKTEQARSTSKHQEEKKEEKKKVTSNTISRPTRNIFKRK